MKCPPFFLFFFLFSLSASAQNLAIKIDYFWVIGYLNQPDSLFVNLLSFNKQPPELQKYPVHIWSSPFRTTVTVADSTGSLLLYSNGCTVVNQSGNILENGDNMLPDDWVQDQYCPADYPFVQTHLLLPDPGSDSLYYLVAYGFHQNTGSGTYSQGLYASRMSANKVYVKNMTVSSDTVFGSHLTACRHANGRDWWFLINRTKTNRYDKYLLDPTGFHYVATQYIGLPVSWQSQGSGQEGFSPDGALYARFTNFEDIFLFDFDRCTGQLSNFRHIEIQHNDNWDSFGGMSFSPNSRFVYTFHGKYCYQVDLQAPDIQASVTEVGFWDGTLVADFLPTYFGKAALAPDGKIYAACAGSTPYLHVIHNPNVKGTDCLLKQHEITLPYSWNTNTMPNFPNFRLGPVSGSTCDTITTTTRVPQEAGQFIKVFPNPTTGAFRLLLPEGMGTGIQLYLFDIAGRLRWQQSEQMGSGWYYLPTGIAPGCYVLELRGAQGVRIGFQRLVVCR